MRTESVRVTVWMARISNVDGSTMYFVDLGLFVRFPLRSCRRTLPSSLLLRNCVVLVGKSSLSSTGYNTFRSRMLYFFFPPHMTSGVQTTRCRNVILPSLNSEYRLMMTTYRYMRAAAASGRAPLNQWTCQWWRDHIFPERTSVFSVRRDLERPIFQLPQAVGLETTAQMETLLSFIGVRKHIDPQLVLNQLS